MLFTACILRCLDILKSLAGWGETVLPGPEGLRTQKRAHLSCLNPLTLRLHPNHLPYLVPTLQADIPPAFITCDQAPGAGGDPCSPEPPDIMQTGPLWAVCPSSPTEP